MMSDDPEVASWEIAIAMEAARTAEKLVVKAQDATNEAITFVDLAADAARRSLQELDWFQQIAEQGNETAKMIYSQQLIYTEQLLVRSQKLAQVVLELRKHGQQRHGPPSR